MDLDYETKAALFRRLDELDKTSDTENDVHLWEEERRRREECRAFTRQANHKLSAHHHPHHSHHVLDRLNSSSHSSAQPIIPDAILPELLPSSRAASLHALSRPQQSEQADEAIISASSIQIRSHDTTMDLTSGPVRRESEVQVPNTMWPPSRRGPDSSRKAVQVTPEPRGRKAAGVVLAEARSKLPRRSSGDPAGRLSLDVVQETPHPIPPLPCANSSLFFVPETPLPPPPAISSTNAKKTAVVKTPPKKRKRGAVELRDIPEERKIFRGLRFYYMPDNDIHPARKIRITRAREYGAVWEHDMSKATHVIVDKSLKWSDIEKFLVPPELSSQDDYGYIVVNEDFPLDCIRYVKMQDPAQIKYEVIGTPAEKSLVPPAVRGWWDKSEGKGHEETAHDPQVEEEAVTAPVDALDVTEPSLPLSARIPAMRRHDTLPARIGELPAGTGEQTLSSPFQSPSRKGRALEDELSKHIAEMQKYKDLPLDTDTESEDRESKDVVEDKGYDSGDVENASPDELAHKQRRKTARTVSARGKTRKGVSAEVGFACHRAGPQAVPGTDPDKDNPNSYTISMLQRLHDYYVRTETPWKPQAYRRAIATLRQQKHLIANATAASVLPGIGPSLAQKIEEIVVTRCLRKLDYVDPKNGSAAANRTIMQGMANDDYARTYELFLGVYGAGPAVAKRWISQGFTTLQSLTKFTGSARLTRNQRIGVDRYDDLNTRIPRHEVTALVNVILATGRAIDPSVDLIPAGSYRRGAATSGDVDFLLTKKPPSDNAKANTLQSHHTSAAESEKERDKKYLADFLRKLITKLDVDGVVVCTLVGSSMANDKKNADVSTERPASPFSATVAGASTKWHGCCVLPEAVAAKLHPPPARSKHVVRDSTPDVCRPRGYVATAASKTEVKKHTGKKMAADEQADNQSTDDKEEGVKAANASSVTSSSSPSYYNPMWRRVDFLVVPPAELGAALLYFTGNDIFNRSMRLLARRRNMRLNQHGLFRDVFHARGGVKADSKVTDGELVEARDERRIFEVLGVRWREPEERWC